MSLLPCDMMAWLGGGKGRKPDVKLSVGHQRESDRWSENRSVVITHRG